jgi:hypothetical protein
MRRVLITGSRAWHHEAAVYNALDAQYAQHGALTVVTGKCPTGADLLAERWTTRSRITRGYDVQLETHPADWGRQCDDRCRHQPRTKNGEPYCPYAGHLRNQHMVDLGADVCLAFPTASSRGTIDCMRRAKAAGIEVLNCGDNSIIVP